MKVQSSAFYNTAIQLNLADIIKLIIGKTVKKGGYIIGLYKLPDNGCQCKECKKSRNS